MKEQLFSFELFRLYKDHDSFFLTIMNFDNLRSFDKSLFKVGKIDKTWFLELFFIRILPSYSTEDF